MTTTVDMDVVVNDALVMTEHCIQALRGNDNVMSGHKQGRSQFLHRVRQDMFPLIYAYFIRDSGSYSAKRLILENILDSNFSEVNALSLEDVGEGLIRYRESAKFNDLIHAMFWNLNNGGVMQDPQSPEIKIEVAHHLSRYISFYLTPESERNKALEEARMCGNKLSSAADKHNHQLLDKVAKEFALTIAKETANAHSYEHFKDVVRTSIAQAQEYHQTVVQCEQGHGFEFMQQSRAPRSGSAP